MNDNTSLTGANQKSSHSIFGGKRVLIAGHKGMVGTVLKKRLAGEGCQILTLGREDADLRRQADVEKWMKKNKPQLVFVAAAKVGGINANKSYPADFLYDNLMIEANIIHASHLEGVEKLISLGSSCIYPKDAEQPMRENALLTGPLEETNQWYAIAKIANIKMCQAYRRQYGCDFISAQPTNLYGPNDNFDLASSHVLPALMRKAHIAKADELDHIDVWGSGRPRRELLHVDDLADALVFLMNNYSDENIVNVGTGKDYSIRELAQMACDVVGFNGELRFDASMPDGTLKKLSDVTKIHQLGWHHSIELPQGIRTTYQWFQENVKN